MNIINESKGLAGEFKTYILERNLADLAVRFGCVLLAAGFLSSARAVTIEMKPDGPISTLSAARDAARKARLAGAHDTVTVTIADGVYPLLEAVVSSRRIAL